MGLGVDDLSERSKWDTGKWDLDRWDVSYIGNIDSLFKKLEKVNIGTYVWEAGVAEPGMDNADIPLRRALANLEK